MHLILCLAEVSRDSVTGFVISGQALLLGSYDLGLLLGTCNDLDGSFLDVLLCDCLAVRPGSEQGSLVHEVLQVRAGESCGGRRNGLEIHVGTDVLVSGVYLEYLLTALDVGVVHNDLSVETSRTEQCRIKDITAVGRRHYDDGIILGKAVHLDKQLVQSLLTLIVTAA